MICLPRTYHVWYFTRRRTDIYCVCEILSGVDRVCLCTDKWIETGIFRDRERWREGKGENNRLTALHLSWSECLSMAGCGAMSDDDGRLRMQFSGLWGQRWCHSLHGSVGRSVGRYYYLLTFLLQGLKLPISLDLWYTYYNTWRERKKMLDQDLVQFYVQSA